MLYYNGLFHDSQGNPLAITSNNSTFTTFDNGSTYLTCEIENKIKNYNLSQSVRISNRIELERRLGFKVS